MSFLREIIAERTANGYRLQLLVLYKQTLTPQTRAYFKPYCEVDGIFPETEND